MPNRTDWSRYGVAPSGDPKTRAFVVTAERGVTVGGRHYAKGQPMARRQGENIRFAIDHSDWASWSEWQRARAGQGRWHDYPQWVADGARDRGVTQAAQRDNPAFNRAYVRWVRSGRTRGTSPTGRLADLLAATGKRPQGATYRVGRSPGYKQAGKIEHRRAAK
jgi:hypothetical protein